MNHKHTKPYCLSIIGIYCYIWTPTIVNQYKYSWDANITLSDLLKLATIFSTGLSPQIAYYFTLAYHFINDFGYICNNKTYVYDVWIYHWTCHYKQSLH